MKKLFIPILVLAMVLALVGCGETIDDVSVDESGIVNSGDGESSSGNQDYSNDELQDIPENSSDKDSDYTEDRADEDTTEVHTHSYASDPDYVQQDTNSGTVYTTETGKRYHSTKHCTGLNNANKIYDSTLSAAKDRGLTACNKCY